jgi:hypothetical protein
MAKPKPHKTGRYRHPSHVGAVPDIHIKRTRAIYVKNVVPCPTCEAGIGEPCLNVKGEPAATYHIARKRMALRKERES